MSGALGARSVSSLEAWVAAAPHGLAFWKYGSRFFHGKKDCQKARSKRIQQGYRNRPLNQTTRQKAVNMQRKPCSYCLPEVA